MTLQKQKLYFHDKFCFLATCVVLVFKTSCRRVLSEVGVNTESDWSTEIIKVKQQRTNNIEI